MNKILSQPQRDYDLVYKIDKQITSKMTIQCDKGQEKSKAFRQKSGDKREIFWIK